MKLSPVATCVPQFPRGRAQRQSRGMALRPERSNCQCRVPSDMPDPVKSESRADGDGTVTAPGNRTMADSTSLKTPLFDWHQSQGGLIDDILVYRHQYGYYLVCNASNRPAVLAQLQQQRRGAVGNFHDRTRETAMIAVQGPEALATVQPLFDQPLEPVKYYRLTMGRVLGDVHAVVSRTGYTGEDGYELIVAANQAERVWNAILASGQSHGILPCGLGARDTLRFEAAMPLYGHELSEAINPYAALVGWAVKLDKGDFIGRESL